ncbi:hypothetical protein GCM10027203_73370 [Nonomuraea fastidiosa]
MTAARPNVLNCGNPIFHRGRSNFTERNSAEGMHAAAGARLKARAVHLAGTQEGAVVQVMPFTLNSAGRSFEPVAVAEKPKLWLEPGPM